MRKTKRKPGEKPRRHESPRPLPLFSDPKVPKGFTKLAAFVISCEGEVPVEEAIREYQTEWCDHPKIEQFLASTAARPAEDLYQYSVICGECGRLKTYQGRPSTQIVRRVRYS